MTKMRARPADSNGKPEPSRLERLLAHKLREEGWTVTENGARGYVARKGDISFAYNNFGWAWHQGRHLGATKMAEEITRVNQPKAEAEAEGRSEDV